MLFTTRSFRLLSATKGSFLKTKPTACGNRAEVTAQGHRKMPRLVVEWSALIIVSVPFLFTEVFIEGQSVAEFLGRTEPMARLLENTGLSSLSLVNRMTLW